jgi:hypothetical protein
VHILTFLVLRLLSAHQKEQVYWFVFFLCFDLKSFWNTKESIYVCNFLSFDSVRHQSYSTQHIAPRVWTSVGRFSFFFGENPSVSVLTLCYENLIGFLLYIYWLVRTNHVFRIFIFSKFTWFSNRAVLAYMITVGSLDQFSIFGN